MPKAVASMATTTMAINPAKTFQAHDLRARPGEAFAGSRSFESGEVGFGIMEILAQL
jgi:hypothetical protein